MLDDGAILFVLVPLLRRTLPIIPTTATQIVMNISLHVSFIDRKGNSNSVPTFVSYLGRWRNQALGSVMADRRLSKDLLDVGGGEKKRGISLISAHKDSFWICLF
jgi:hypothetical protein